MKLLGLDTLMDMVNYNHELLRKENEELKKSLAELKEQIDELEIPDMDDYVQHSDLDDNIESYLNNNNYATQSYVDDEIGSKVEEAVEEAIEDADIEEKVRDLFNDASPAPMSEQEIKDEIIRSLRAMFLDELEVKIKLK